MSFIRKRIRLEHYDYSAEGAYFVTVCTAGKRPIFWENVAAATCRQKPIPLSRAGRIVDAAIQQIPNHYSSILVDKYCIMPDHIHMILLFQSSQQSTAPTLSTVIGSMKRWATMEAGFPLWQKSFIDRVIRNERAYQAVWEYIDNNPRKMDTAYDEIDFSQI